MFNQRYFVTKKSSKQTGNYRAQRTIDCQVENWLMGLLMSANVTAAADSQYRITAVNYYCNAVMSADTINMLLLPFDTGHLVVIPSNTACCCFRLILMQWHHCTYAMAN